MSTETRQLAAIMFTDIVGYTSMMGSNSGKALELVRQNFQIQRPLVEKNHGKWIKEIGDGTLSQFNSAFDAVNCAIAIQEAVKTGFDGHLRIGIHLGDIFLEDNDVYGDGVNIAARLESIADPGGIYVSEAIEKAVRGQGSLRFHYVGEVKLKNVSYPVRTFSVQGEDLPLPDSARLKNILHKPYSRQYWRKYGTLIVVSLLLILSTIFLSRKNSLSGSDARINSLAVLPIDNLSMDPEQEYITAGIHDNLITALSRIHSLRIISRTSTLKFKNHEKSAAEIATELGVDAIIESSVFFEKDSFRLNVQLVQAFPEEKHVWANIYDRPVSNILNVFNELTESITQEIDISVTPDENLVLAEKVEVNPEAYRYYLRGLAAAETLNSEEMELSLRYFARSLEIDSTFAPAYAGIAFTWIAKLQMYKASGQEAVPQIYSNYQKALELNPDLWQAEYIRALMSAQAEWDWDKSEAAFRKTIALNPNYALAHAYYAHILMFRMKFEEALKELDTAIDLDPLNHLVYALQSVVLWHDGKWNEAIKADSIARALSGNKAWEVDILHVSVAYLKGDYAHSFELEKQKNLDSLFQLEIVAEFERSGYQDAMAHWADILAKQFMQNSGSAFMVSVVYNRAGEYEKALDWLEKGYDQHDVNMPYAFVFREFDSLRSNPRFIAIARKMELPYDRKNVSSK